MDATVQYLFSTSSSKLGRVPQASLNSGTVEIGFLSFKNSKPFVYCSSVNFPELYLSCKLFKRVSLEYHSSLFLGLTSVVSVLGGVSSILRGVSSFCILSSPFHKTSVL
jgi:hypothetical protein